MIAIIGILIALLLPAVQAAREAARRISCTNNLKQLGLAIHNFHDTNDGLPPAGVADEYPSWAWFILPYIENVNLHENYDPASSYYLIPAVVKRTMIPVYICPTRGKRTPTVPRGQEQDLGAVGDYAGNVGDIGTLVGQRHLVDGKCRK